MSRMTKFLKQTCLVEAYSVDENGKPEHNRFGELIYQPAVECKCRNEQSVRDFQLSNGSIVRSSARYFLDNSMELKVDYRLDGHLIILLDEYIGPLGELVGYEVFV